MQPRQHAKKVIAADNFGYEPDICDPKKFIRVFYCLQFHKNNVKYNSKKIGNALERSD
jgi:hypothetical protein